MNKILQITTKIIIACFLISVMAQEKSQQNNQENMQVQVGARESKKVSLALIAIDRSSHAKYTETHLLTDCKMIAKDLEFTDQFLVSVISMSAIPHKKEIKELEKKGYEIAVFITENRKKKTFDIRMYDVKKGLMVTDKGYTLHKSGSLERGWIHSISDLILEKLTHSPGFFLSKITYCKQLSNGHRQVCVSDYDGSHEQVVAKAKLLIAPRWNLDEEYPAILYSKYTSSNVRLMEVDVLTGKEKTVASYEGLNMLPAFSPDTNEVIVCLSCKGGTQLYSYVYDKAHRPKNYTQLTFNMGNNISPTVLENGDIVFCSDFIGGKPQLYRLSRLNDSLVCLSQSGDVCFSPAYCPLNKKIAYTKMVDGVGQLFLYSVVTGKDIQITFDGGHKQEVSWSPCGHYVVFGFSNEKSKRIAIQNIQTGSRHFITDEKMLCTYPSWSPNFTVFPVIK